MARLRMASDAGDAASIGQATHLHSGNRLTPRRADGRHRRSRYRRHCCARRAWRTPDGAAVAAAWEAVDTRAEQIQAVQEARERRDTRPSDGEQRAARHGWAAAQQTKRATAADAAAAGRQ